MPTFERLDGPVELEATDDLRFDIEDALSFWYRHGRHPYRSLGGISKFIITSADFRYVDSPRFWRFTFEQTEDLVKRLWPADGEEGLALLRRISGGGPEVPGNP